MRASKWIVTASVVVLVVVAGAGVALTAKQRHDHQVAAALAAKNLAAKKAYIAKLHKVVDDSSTLDSLLYDTASRYYTDHASEQQALQDMATISGEVSGSSESPLLSDMLNQSQTMTKAVCQCSDLTTRQELLAAYDADTQLKTDTSQLQGRITTLTVEAK